MKMARALASLGGIGWCPVASGTAASAAVVVAYGVLWPLNAAWQAALLGGVLVAGLWSSEMSARHSGHDPSYVVIDEMAGMLIACFMVPKSPGLLAAAFVLFRVLDIGKWSPMKQLERLPGGWGIMADDVAAGLIARLLLLAWTVGTGAR